ncbi:TetR/AcrR family transcriptional regulator [Planomonospora sp. ID67723]|uniref:TetR/AcrR family transcriptional regulator n=1 Tax=Planomonospora sp. ID67723 TaxID=2738134 RepID=UPI0027DB5D0C|nr:TetR/AcrR family transcriptional regulator [Planomonospora sp. ID67723]
MWLRPSRAGRDAPPLSRDRIVEEAVALLDAEGADRLTMRRLAERLGTGSTTLYWHVKTKDDVLDLALDMIFAEVEIPPEGGRGWRADITALINGWRAVLLRHPWSAALLGRPMLGPNVLARSEFLYATLLEAGITEPHLTAAAYGLSNYVIGSGLMQATWPADDEQEVRQAAREHLHANRERYPALAAHGPLVADDDRDTGFTLGLTWLLDGIQASVTNVMTEYT